MRLRKTSSSTMALAASCVFLWTTTRSRAPRGVSCWASAFQLGGTTTIGRSSPTRRLATPTPSSSVAATTLCTSFDDGQRPYEITTPIYYVNDKPHIGHAYTSVGT